MNIGGLQKNSLIDYPGRPAAVLFTQGCNWLCPYCHNAELIPRVGKSRIRPEKVIEMLNSRPAEARNLVVTGGEPTQQQDLIPFLQMAKRHGIRVKLDTNGSNPALLQQILTAELVDYVAMDVKGPLEHYERFCGRRILENVIRSSIHFVLQSNIDHEFRTTVVPALHEPSDFGMVGRAVEGGRRLFLQAFRAEHTLRAKLMDSTEPDQAYLEACAEQARSYIETYIRV